MSRYAVFRELFAERRKKLLKASIRGGTFVILETQPFNSPIKIKKKVSFWPIVVKKVFSGGCWLPLVTLRVRKWTIPSCGLTFSNRG